MTARKNDASDADAQVVEAQMAQVVPPLFWTRIDASGGLDATLRAATDAVLGSSRVAQSKS